MYSTLTNFQSASRFEANSTTGDPLFESESSYRLQDGSAAQGKSAYISDSDIIGIVGP
jgi:hypothetical protein